MHQTLIHLNREYGGVESNKCDEILSNGNESPVVEVGPAIVGELEKASQKTSPNKEALNNGAM